MSGRLTTKLVRSEKLCVVPCDRHRQTQDEDAPRMSSHTHACEMTCEAHCPHNTEGVMNITPDPGDTGPLVVITVTDTCTANR